MLKYDILKVEKEEIKMNDKIFWYRFGDNAEYISTNFEDFINQLVYRSIEYVYLASYEYGLEAEGFRNLNYISAFFGDKEAQPIRNLTNKEIDYINDCI